MPVFLLGLDTGAILTGDVWEGTCAGMLIGTLLLIKKKMKTVYHVHKGKAVSNIQIPPPMFSMRKLKEIWDQIAHRNV